MISKKIMVLPGDGIGKEVTHSSVGVLKKVAQVYQHQFIFEEALIGHSAILQTGSPLPEETLTKCLSADAVLLGAVGDPIYDMNPSLKVRPEQGLLKIRQELGLFANLRPIRLFEELIHASSIKPEKLKGADILFFRELTGDIYFGQPRERRDNGQTAIDTMVYSKPEVQRIALMAFQAARKRRKKLCSVDKANVLESSRLWREVVQEISGQFPDVEVTHMYVDNAAMQLIKDPRQFDVILTGNMFGDILTDEASQIAGSLGMLPSASVGEKHGLYEPIHGSAPDIAGKNIANPIASILSAAMMLEFSFHLRKESEAIFLAVQEFLRHGFRTRDTADTMTPPSQVLNTEQTTEKIISYIV